MEWVDIQEWVQDGDNFCLNIAPFFVDTFDGFRTSYIGVSSMDYFPAMRVCRVGASRVLDRRASTETVYHATLVSGRLCVRNKPKLNTCPKFAYLKDFEVIEAINAEKFAMTDFTPKNANWHMYDNADLTSALLMYSGDWYKLINTWLKRELVPKRYKRYVKEKIDEMRATLLLDYSLHERGLEVFKCTPIEQEVKAFLNKTSANPDELRETLRAIDRDTLQGYVETTARKLVAILDEGFVKECQVSYHPEVLYRGITLDVKDPDDDCCSMLFDSQGFYYSSYIPGGRPVGFISTSRDFEAAKKFTSKTCMHVLAIHTQDVPTLVMKRTTYHHNEKEVLLSRFTQLTHNKTERDANNVFIHHVNAKYLGPKPTPSCDVYTLAGIVQCDAKDDVNVTHSNLADETAPKYTHAWSAHQATLPCKCKAHHVLNGLDLACELATATTPTRDSQLAERLGYYYGGPDYHRYGGPSTYASTHYEGREGGASSSYQGEEGSHGGGSKASSSYQGEEGSQSSTSS